MALKYNKEEGEWGKQAERKVLAGLTARGLDAVMPELQFDDKADYAKYEHDIIVRDKEDLNKSVIVESKRRRVKFTTHLDYPYPTVIVDACSTFDLKIRKPFMYFIVSENLNGVLAVPVLSFKHWEKTSKFNNRKDADEWYYECPIKHGISFDNAVAFINFQIQTK